MKTPFMGARKYILVSKGFDTRLNPVEGTDIYENFEDFQKRVNEILSNDNGADAIVFAGEVSCEWEFKPVEIVKKYQWAEKK